MSMVWSRKSSHSRMYNSLQDSSVWKRVECNSHRDEQYHRVNLSIAFTGLWVAGFWPKDWPQLVSQNVLNLIWKNSQICHIWGQSDPLCAQIWWLCWRLRVNTRVKSFFNISCRWTFLLVLCFIFTWALWSHWKRGVIRVLLLWRKLKSITKQLYLSRIQIYSLGRSMFP